jgi:RNA polymerase sigma-54 factor
MLAQSQSLGVSLEQGLRLNQQMILSIKLMELPVMELRERIEAEIAVNPALDAVENVKNDAPQETSPADDNDGDFFETAIATPLYSRDAVFGDVPGDASSGGEDAKRQFLEGAVSRVESLQDHLLWQFRLQKLDGEARRIGELLIGNLDKDGFHLIAPAGLLPGVAPAVIGIVLSVIQALDPQGCAVADYRESLAVQAKLRFGNDSRTSVGIERLLSRLSDLEKGKFPLVAKQNGMNANRAEYLFSRIKELSPFPGRRYSGNLDPGGGVRFVVPDIEVYRKDGELVIKLNEEEIPALRVSPFFAELKKYKPEDQKTQVFVNEKVAEAQWFINAVSRRNHTLLRVTQAIVEKQKAFFEKGAAHIVPLTRGDIADLLELDDSTVSRLASSKYIQTEWGIYGVGHFFSNAISGRGSQGSSYSKAGVKEIIREIIAKSKKRTSDNEIACLLEERGIKIARRTVAKYRSELKNV